MIWPHLHVLSSFLGVNVVAYDYSGYGISDGSPSEQAVYEDLAAVYRLEFPCMREMWVRHCVKTSVRHASDAC